MFYNHPSKSMDKKISRQFFNDQAEHWDETARNNDPVKLRALADRLMIPEQGWVLDVGTGTGVFLPYIKERVNHKSRLISIDFAFNMLEIAHTKNSTNSVDFVCSEIETLHISPNCFDVIICYSTFPHFHDKPRALSNIFNLLKRDGWLYVCHTASRETINNIHRNILDFEDHLIPERQEMEYLLTLIGFLNIEITDQPDSYLASARK
ncbi:MAG: class I SAM-dependent methyltransferase [Chloroflexi bacterium]|nr:class I SAM-dependent methyltransferase [Chloroflexota bacterium]